MTKRPSNFQAPGQVAVIIVGVTVLIKVHEIIQHGPLGAPAALWFASVRKHHAIAV